MFYYYTYTQFGTVIEMLKVLKFKRKTKMYPVKNNVQHNDIVKSYRTVTSKVSKID